MFGVKNGLSPFVCTILLESRFSLPGIPVFFPREENFPPTPCRLFYEVWEE